MINFPGFQRLDSNDIGNYHNDEIYAVSCVRNESRRLPHFLEYYRNIGVQRFFIIDNDSTDNTLELLLSQRDVHVFGTKESFPNSRCGMDWMHILLQSFALNHWVIVADADEFFICPLPEMVRLPDLRSFLIEEKTDAVYSVLLDVYGKNALNGSEESIERHSLLKECPYYEVDSIYLKGYRTSPLSVHR